MVASVIKTSLDKGVDVGMCGEMAAEPGAVVLLLGMGLTEFSVNPLSAPRVKQLARLARTNDCRRLAKEALKFETESEVRNFVNRELNKMFPELFDPDGRMLY
jgi:phosphoenolpyruvate-protein kinase (PTS system EI component)